MSAALSISQDDAIKVLGDFLSDVLPSDVKIVVGQLNRVPEPKNQDFVVMIPLFMERLETNVTSYSDGFPSNPQIRIDLVPTKLTVQLDVHGPNGADNVQIITTLFRSSYGVDQFATSNIDVTPLYTSEPRQAPFINGEQQVEQRWTVDVYMQVNAATTVSQEFADQLEVGVINVQATYPII